MFLFLDLETTGLKAPCEKIAELAYVVMEEPAMLERERGGCVIHLGRDEWSACTPFIIDMHRRHGLLEESVSSTVTLQHAEGELLRVVRRYEEEARARGKRLYLVLAGSSVHFDRGFLEVHMPLLYDKLFYRQFDVSSLYPLFFNVKRFPTHPVVPKDQQPHRAAADVDASIGIARHYREATQLLVDLAEAVVDAELASDACAAGGNDGADVDEAQELSREVRRLAQLYHERYVAREGGTRGYFSRTPERRPQ